MQSKPGIDVTELIDGGGLSRFQKLAFAACAIIAMVDGFDTQVIAFVAPVVVRDLNLTPGTMGSIFAAGLVGMMLGSMLLGPIGDRFGRRLVILASFAGVGGFSLLTAGANGSTELMLLRFLTGLCLGGTIPNAIALTAEYAPARIRTMMVTAMFCGFPLGASLGGLLVSQTIDVVGWRGVFIAGGIVPLALALLLAPILPESIRGLVARGGDAERIERILRRLRPNLPLAGPIAIPPPDAAPKKGTVATLVSRSFLPLTAMLWFICFFNLLMVYFLLNWLPSLLNARGAELSDAIVAATLFNLGGIAGSLAMARLIDRLGPYRILGPAYAAAVLLVAAIGLAPNPPLLFACIFLAGTTVLGSQFCLNALAAQLYPTRIRSTGIGWALGIGRLGSILGPLAGSWLIGLGWPLEQLFVLAGIPAFMCLLGLLLLRRTRQVEES